VRVNVRNEGLQRLREGSRERRGSHIAVRPIARHLPDDVISTTTSLTHARTWKGTVRRWPTPRPRDRLHIDPRRTHKADERFWPRPSNSPSSCNQQSNRVHKPLKLLNLIFVLALKEIIQWISRVFGRAHSTARIGVAS
jgi:hypothetical protein